MKTEKEKMIAGEYYFSLGDELTGERKTAKELCAQYNSKPTDHDRDALQKLLKYETNAYFEPPFYCDYGYNIKLGQNFYANHNLVVLDCAPVTIGDNVMIGPNVTISTAGHPIDVATRNSGLEFAKAIKIGNNVWIGANVVILPGITIGDNTTIGAGSVVTRDIPSDCIAFGNPCRVKK